MDTKIDKKYFIELEEMLQHYANDRERYRGTFYTIDDRPAEAYVILALRCINFMDDRELVPSVHLNASADRPRQNEVKLDFFPRATQVFFSSTKEVGINTRMKGYMKNMNIKENLKSLDYTVECIYSGFCRYCNKKTAIKHPDYDERSICKDCLKERNRYLVVIE